MPPQLSDDAVLRRFTLAEFRNWLHAKPPEESVGRGLRGCECPLANFLHDNGAPWAVVGVSKVFLWGDTEEAHQYRLLPWARAIRLFVDTHYVHAPVPAGALLLGIRALHL